MVCDSVNLLAVIRHENQAMARHAQEAIEYDDEGSETSVLGRFLLWAGLAAVALGSAALAAQTPSGAQRLAAFLGRGAPPASTIASRSGLVMPGRPSEADIESRRLAETVRTLSADRDRLLARLDTLERNIDVTGALPRDNAPAPTAPVLPSTSLSAGTPTSALPGWSLSPNLPSAGTGGNGTAGAGLSASEQAVGSVATKTEFAADIGGDATFDGLRALWASLKGAHGALFEGLRPVVSVREGTKPGALELRLLVGPLGNAAAAARLCANLGAAGLACQPTVFDGQRFALK
jgi:hypothetical protein